MGTVQQESLFGDATQAQEAVVGNVKVGVSWLAPRTVRAQGVEKSLRILGVEAGADRSEGWALRAWKEAMKARTGLTEAEFRRWVDWECAIYNNRSLSGFIWEIA